MGGEGQLDGAVLLVAEAGVHRRGLELLLTAHGIRVADSTDDVEAVRAAVCRLAPRLVLLDAGLPAGAECLVRALREIAPRLPVLAYGDRRAWPLQELLDAGLRGFVLTTADPATFVGAITSVARGLTWLDPEFSVAPASAADRPGREALTDRERQVMGLLAHGLTGREIAARLFLSPATVRTHVQNAMHKLGARTRAQAIAIVSADGRPPMAA